MNYRENWRLPENCLKENKIYNSVYKNLSYAIITLKPESDQYSLFHYGRFPDLTPIALLPVIKQWICCAISRYLQ